jgi:hypothetical protein
MSVTLRVIHPVVDPADVDLCVSANLGALSELNHPKADSEDARRLARAMVDGQCISVEERDHPFDARQKIVGHVVHAWDARIDAVLVDGGSNAPMSVVRYVAGWLNSPKGNGWRWTLTPRVA